MITHINDRKLSEYPFFDIGQAPFPPGCIKQLGVCITGETTGLALYASAITVSMDGVLVSLCRDVQGSDSGEVLGSVYAQASSGSVSMELTGGTVHGSVSMLIDKSMLQNSYGSYNGKFYLDPSCVTYMGADVQGSLEQININGTTFAAAQSLDFSTMGDVLELDVQGQTAYLIGTADVDSYALVDEVQDNSSKVQTINELSITGNTETYPAFTLEAAGSTTSTGSIYYPITIVPLRGSTTSASDLILELTGGTAFPHCYSSKDESEATYVADNEQS